MSDRDSASVLGRQRLPLEIMFLIRSFKAEEADAVAIAGLRSAAGGTPAVR
jgi:hypothetical protein